ncbi:MAG: hypothetical protein KBH82_07165 [Syntrophorhabdaceae bacterium]|jgi:hypothetical protein|nr:hypothetical protein [Syntrophorhabdaceae bacterium]
MKFITDLKGHQSARRSFIKYPYIYGTEEPTYSYFDETGKNLKKNIIVEGRLCTKGNEIMGRKIDDCPFVYMPPDYWKSLNAEEKLSKAKGYFDKMIEDKDPATIPRDAVFVVRLAIMNVKSGWCEVYGGHTPDYIAYKDYLKMTDEQFAGFLDKLLGTSSTYVDKKTIADGFQNSSNLYYPTKEDLKDALEKCSSRLNAGKEEFHINFVLDCIGENLVAAGYKLAEDWRTVTERNIKKWSIND